MEEALLRKNLKLIRRVSEQAGVEIILAFKAFALWKTFPIFKEYGFRSTASSINEARLAFEEMGSPAHTYAPAYTEVDMPVFLEYSSHITFNSLTQFQRFYPTIGASGQKVSCGLRINPEYSVVGTDLYNPCAPGSRMGVAAEYLGGTLPEGIDGLHFHTLCESTSYDLEKTLEVVKLRFRKQLRQIKWLNMGGGHLMTRRDYNTEHLIALLRSFKTDYPNLHLILEPGSAFAWQTGFLRTTVVDVVENKGIRTAVIDASFACHMPDCLEMPYQPAIRGAESVEATSIEQILPEKTETAEMFSQMPEQALGSTPEKDGGKYRYRIGGCSCLSGDFMGDWLFNKPLKPGDPIVFEDMIHYTTVKTTMFNGITHPSIAFLRQNGQLETLRTFAYEDYKNRMD
jgi:carboxynorspermidine decarboxylase